MRGHREVTPVTNELHKKILTKQSFKEGKAITDKKQISNSYTPKEINGPQR